MTALTPLAFPAIVTPYEIAALVVFLALSPDVRSRLLVGAVMLAIMVLNLFFMLMTRHILRVLTVLMPILGAVLGIVQGRSGSRSSTTRSGRSGSLERSLYRHLARVIRDGDLKGLLAMTAKKVTSIRRSELPQLIG